MEEKKQVPSVGRVVYYVLETGPKAGEHRPALIVRTWGDTPDTLVNLHVFLDGSNDYERSLSPGAMTIWRTSVQPDESGKPGTWHWPEYVPAK